MTQKQAATWHELLAGRHILIVEDEYFIADDIARAVKKAGASVAAVVGDLDDAVTLLTSGESTVDGAVLDVNVRGKMIYPVAEMLRDRNIPFVFATGYDRAALNVMYRDVRRLEKPFEPSDLAKALATAA